MWYPILLLAYLTYGTYDDTSSYGTYGTYDDTLDPLQFGYNCGSFNGYTFRDLAETDHLTIDTINHHCSDLDECNTTLIKLRLRQTIHAFRCCVNGGGACVVDEVCT